MAESFQSHVAEDASDIPLVFYIPMKELKPSDDDDSESCPHLFRALSHSRKQGAENKVREIRMLNIDSRENSFESASKLTREGGEDAMQWPGPNPKEMAMAGFYRSLSGNADAECAYCGIKIRDWQPSDDPWQRQKTLSPRCLRLRQVGDEGIRPAPEGKKRLRHSFSSWFSLKKHLPTK